MNRLLSTRSARSAAPLALALAALAAGCGEGDRGEATARAAPAPPAKPALCRKRPRIRVLGHVAAPEAVELSGLVASPARRGVFWALNDSGASARLLAFTSSGATVAEVDVGGAQNVDWEDIAVGRAGALLAGDIGDNDAQRPSITVYAIPEQLASGTVAATARYELRYPDGAHDAETLLYDRASGAIVVVSKSFFGTARVYSARRPSSRNVTTLRRGARLRLDTGGAVTAGDVSADGRTIVLRMYDAAYAWTRRTGESVVAALRRAPCRVAADLVPEGQGEALALSRDGRAFVTVPEGPRPELRRYESR